MSAVEGDPARLLVTTPAWTREFPLDRDVMVLGRDPGSDIPVDDLEMSRRHAELRRSGAGHVIVDLQSLNGLVMGGQRVAQRALVDGDEIRIGQGVTLKYVASAAEPAGAMAWPVTPASASAAAGWYADPSGSSALRYWDGRAWTEHVAAHPAMAAPPVPPAPPAPPAVQPQGLGSSGRTARDLAFLGGAAALVLGGSLLPWLGRDGRSATSWDLPVISMFRGQPAGGPSTGIVLLVVALLAGALAAFPFLTRRSPRPGYGLLAASLAIDTGIAAVMASATVTPHLNLGAGAVVTLAGGLLLGVYSLRARSRLRAAVRAGRTP
ncbi:MAG: FHA domain-containing protein [Actinomycetota bacterium]|nr:FHA domain-containing protein [Actinomycetota bacterium]